MHDFARILAAIAFASQLALSSCGKSAPDASNGDGKAAAAPWRLQVDAKAEGRFGIIRTPWHAKTNQAYETITVFRPGKRDAHEYQEHFKQEHSVLEGEYDVSINGMVLERLPVKAGHASVIQLGALRSMAEYARQLAILDSEDREVARIQGGEVISLPVGTYHVRVGTQSVDVKIEDGQLTDF
jgi:hypothetical protein